MSRSPANFESRGAPISVFRLNWREGRRFGIPVCCRWHFCFDRALGRVVSVVRWEADRNLDDTTAARSALGALRGPARGLLTTELSAEDRADHRVQLHNAAFGRTRAMAAGTGKIPRTRLADRPSGREGTHLAHWRNRPTLVGTPATVTTAGITPVP